MDLTVDTNSEVPPFEQVRAHIAAAIQSGALPMASRLPTVRRLAEELTLAPNTVARAYRELELAGFIETRGRNGSFVAGAASPQRAAAVKAARTFAMRMADLGIAGPEALAIVRREIEAHFGG